MIRRKSILVHHKILSAQCVLWVSCVCPLVCGAQDRSSVRMLADGIELYELEAYEAADVLLSGIDASELRGASLAQWREYTDLARDAATAQQSIRREFEQARRAIADGDFARARELLGAILAHEYTPIELQITARARLAKVSMLERRKAPSAVPARRLAAPAVPSTVQQSTDPVGRAREFIALGEEAIRRGDYPEAQAYFNRALIQVPSSPLEEVVIAVSRAAVEHMPVAKIHEVERVAPPRHRVAMNLQLGVGRLIGVQSFQFVGGPPSGVGAPGFVQLPHVSRTQIKTSVSMPARSLGARSYTQIQDYLVLFKPKIAPDAPAHDP